MELIRTLSGPAPPLGMIANAKRIYAHGNAAQRGIVRGGVRECGPAGSSARVGRSAEYCNRETKRRSTRGRARGPECAVTAEGRTRSAAERGVGSVWTAERSVAWTVVYLAHPRTCRNASHSKAVIFKPYCMFRGVLKSADGAGLLSASRAPAATQPRAPRRPRPGAGHAQSVHTLHPGQGSRFWFHGMSAGGSRFRFHGDCGCNYARRICNGEARLHVPVPHILLGGSQVLLEFTGSGRHPAARGCNAPCGRVLLRRPRSPPCRPPWRREAPWRRR
jgi:hypothetical protein